MLEPLLTAHEAGVLGCLVENEATSPDAYPPTANALRDACNQSTRPDPVMTLTDREDEDERALDLLRERGRSRRPARSRHHRTRWRDGRVTSSRRWSADQVRAMTGGSSS